MAAWTTIGAWLLVAAVAFAAHLFGREARNAPDTAVDQHPSAVRRSRLGLAISITGPLMVFLTGLLIAASTGRWLAVGVGTVVAIAVVSTIGLLLAPQ